VTQHNNEETIKLVIQSLECLNKTHEDHMNCIGNLETQVGTLGARPIQEQPLEDCRLWNVE